MELIKDKQLRKDLIYMDMAKDVARFSYANRRKVGCIIVSKDGNILGTGYNGTPKGTDNKCEDENNITQPYVIHAEENAVLNSETTDLKDSTAYVTLSPCLHCASVLIQKKVGRVVFSELYRDDLGVKYLEKNGVVVEHVKI